ncbi:MAG: sigma-70 family RNA polymerase sigma factor [Lachnospiraceae bacterium]|nr:sigma-70 family RNA polymerase sigma factor [Lachnospiraceae bacterium]
MEDEKIVALYWAREERAIEETQKKYGRYLFVIADRILLEEEDSSECVNDTYWKAWDSMPPHRPANLATYLGKIVRETAIDMFRRRNREKRKASEYAVSLAELEDCVSGGNTTEQSVDLHLLAAAIGRYLRTLPKEARDLFVGRYYFMDSLREVASYHGMSQSKAKSILFRTRQGLKAYLEQEGFTL